MSKMENNNNMNDILTDADRKRFDCACGVLRYLRTLHGLTQEELAKECGLPVTTISNIERGYTNAQIATIVRLAEWFGLWEDAIVYNDFSLIVPALDRLDKPHHQTSHRLASYRLHRGKVDESVLRGEQFVEELEKRKLSGSPYAKAVTARFADDESAGFQILSFRPEGTPLYVMVVTSPPGERTKFEISQTKLAFAKYCAETQKEFRLYWIYDFIDSADPRYLTFNAETLLNQIQNTIEEEAVWKAI